MLATIFAFWTAYPIADFAIWVVIVCCVCGLVKIYFTLSGVSPPAWFWQAVWLVVGAVVIILLIVFISNFASTHQGPIFGP